MKFSAILSIISILTTTTSVLSLPITIIPIPGSSGNGKGGNINAILPRQRNRTTKSKSTSGGGTGTGTTTGATTDLAGVTVATDGVSMIVEKEVVIQGLNVRFKVSGPEDAFVQAQTGAAGAGAGAGGATDTGATGVGATTGNGRGQGRNRNKNNARQAATQGLLGINVLLHGDGGQSFFDFPNQGVKDGLMGIAVLSPDESGQFRWGGFDPNDQTGLIRPDGGLHSSILNELLTTELPKVINFDDTKVFFEGVSGGSLLLSGFMIPMFGASLGVPGVVFGCGGLPPQVDVQGDISNIRLHWQSTVDELTDLQDSIPQSIAAYEGLAANAGLSDTQINQLLTADASPNGGHCEFDEQDFVSGVQLLSDTYGDILRGKATLNNVDIINGVVGTEDVFNQAPVQPQPAKSIGNSSTSSLRAGVGSGRKGNTGSTSL